MILRCYLLQGCVGESVAADLELAHVLVQGREQVLEVFQSGSFLAVGGQDVDELAAEVVEQSRVRDVLGHEPPEFA